MNNFKLLTGENNEHIIWITTGNPSVELRYKIISDEEHDNVQFFGACIGDVTTGEVDNEVIEIVTGNLVRRFGNAEYLP